MIKKYCLLTFCFFLALSAGYGQIILETDYTNAANAKGNMQNHLDIYNRITPINGFRSPGTPNTSLCIVRPLGGVNSAGMMDQSIDSYKWDGNSFVTDFSNLQRQIDAVKTRGFGVYQILLDKPSWDFQRNADGSLPGGSYITSTYGNAEPPLDFNAWARYLREVMTFLVNTYGREEMLNVQFCIGREVGTSGHWTGTQDQFFRYYRRSVQSVLAILPEATVGCHFLWGSARTSWGPDFVKWCKTNDVPYDFVGVSYYPFYNRADRTNFDEVYTKDFGVIKDIPEWNPTATLQLHEFALIESLSSAGNAYVEASEAHQNSFMVGLMKMFYENDMSKLFLWGNGDNYKPAMDEFIMLEGNTYHKNSKRGSQSSNDNYVNAIFTSDVPNDKLNILAYNYSANQRTNVTENLNLVATVNAPNGTSFRYRSAVYNKTTGAFNYSAWANGSTSGGSGGKSKISLDRSLPVFSFLKYEIEIDQSNTNTNSPPIVSIASPSNNATFELGQEIMINADATDPDGNLSKVNFFINDVLERSDTQRPFAYSFTPTSVGTYTVTARAVDSENARTDAVVSMTVVEQNLAPTGSFTTPVSNILLEGYNQLIVTVEASDPNGDAFTVMLKINGEEIRSESVAPYEWGHAGSPNPEETLGLQVGEHLIEAIVTDERGLSTTISKTITVDRITGTTTEQGINEAMVFPNPSALGFFQLSVATDYEVLTFTGKSLFTGNGSVIDLSSYPKGIYLLKIDQKIIRLVK